MTTTKITTITTMVGVNDTNYASTISTISTVIYIKFSLSTYLIGKSTSLVILSRHKMFLNENRFKWMIRTSGNLQTDSCLVASRWTLHFGQYLYQTQLFTRGNVKKRVDYWERVSKINLIYKWTPLQERCRGRTVPTSPPYQKNGKGRGGYGWIQAKKIASVSFASLT